MPFVPVPSLIEVADFANGGFAPDAQTVAQEPNFLPDALNLLPDVGGSDTLVTRKGFKRLREELAGLSTHYVKHIWPFRGNGTSYLICVLSDDSANANNVRLYAINLDDDSVARIDTAGRTWANPDRNHWGMGIQEVFYGGSPGNDVYSWDPETDTWNDAAQLDSTWKTWVDDVDDNVDTATERARDFAWNGKEVVTFSGDQYAPAKSIRFDEWESGQRYKRGEQVSRKTVWDSVSSYWKSFECVKAHIAGTDSDEPGTGANWQTYWKKVRLPKPVNDENETSDKWYFVPVAPGSSVAMWHGDRFWIRFDGQGDKSRALYSAPVKPEKGADVPGVVFDMTDFAPGNDLRGPGGGWIPFNDGSKEGVLEAMWSYGPYGLFFKRQATWILTGQSDETFTVRRLSRHVGAVGPQCVVELDSLVYFLSDDGLYVTDGTAVQPVRNNGRVRQTLISRIDAMHAEGAAGNLRDPQVWVYDDRVWMSLPAASEAEPELTLVYDPARQSWWKLDLPTLAATVARHQGVPRLYFSAPESYSVRDLVYVYDHEDAGDQDDTGVDTYAAQDISWRLKTTWWPFGVSRQERRIRKVWAVVKGAMTYTLKAFRNWSETSVKTTTRVVTSADPGQIEGEWFADSHAVAFELSGPEAPTSVYGIAVRTQPRRERYHS